MRNLWRFSGALALLMLFVNTAQADVISPFVRAKCDSMRVALYGQSSTLMSIHQIGLFPERNDATRRLPQEKIDLAIFLVRNIDADADGVLIGATSPKRIDPIHTQGSTTRDINIQEDFQQGRARFVNDITGRRCIVAPEGIHNDEPCVYLMIVRRAPGAPSLVPGRNTVTPAPSVNLQGIRDTINQVIGSLNKQENRITYLENNMLSKNSLGFSVSLGYCSYDINNHAFRGPTVVVTGRYYDLAIEGYVSELFNDSQEMLKSSGNDLYLRFSDNNIRGGSIFWAPAQGEVPMWGKYWQLGVTGLYGDQSNIEHIASLYSYYAGPALKVFVPLKSAIKLPIVLEGFGTVGYGTTTMSATSYETAPTKSQGFGYGLRGALVIRRR